MHHTNSGAPSTSAPARKFPQISPRASWCSEASAGHSRLWLGLLTCVDSDEVIPSSAGLLARSWFEDFYYWVGFFPSGKKAALAERQEMRLLSCNECFTSLLYTDFLHYHMQSAWPQLPSLPCRDGGKEKMHWDYRSLGCRRNNDLLKSSVNDQHREDKHLWPIPNSTNSAANNS